MKNESKIIIYNFLSLGIPHTSYSGVCDISVKHNVSITNFVK